MCAKKIFVFFIFFTIVASIFAMSGVSALTPKYFPIYRKIRDITDFMWPVELTSNSELKINVSTTSGELEIGCDIPAGFESQLYFKDALTRNIYYKINCSGSMEVGGALHGYIKSTGPCIIGLSGLGTVNLMYFPIFDATGIISSDKNITSLDAPMPYYTNVPNPAYFKFKTPKDVCVYAFGDRDGSELFYLTGMDESKSTVKTVVIDEGDVSDLSFAFFVFYNRSGGPVHDVKLIDYGAYYGGKSTPAIYGLIPLSLVLIAVGVSWYWIKKKE
jgi:hypothetical protein